MQSAGFSANDVSDAIYAAGESLSIHDVGLSGEVNVGMGRLVNLLQSSQTNSAAAS